jgi:site-specific DNA-methyltransferase (cytosine-N4-specific)
MYTRRISVPQRVASPYTATMTPDPQIVVGDARDLSMFPDDHFKCLVASPPYFDQRVYGNDPNEIGRGTLAEYYEDMRLCAREWFRVTDGVLFLNLGDKAACSGGAGGDHKLGGSKDHIPKYGGAKKDKRDRPCFQWLNIPNKVADIFVEEGWLLRAEIIWDKLQAKREDYDHTRRPGSTHEKIFMLASTRDYEFYGEALVEPGNIWHFPAEKRKKSHYAPFPMELPLRCIPLVTRMGDRVLDPFVGSGTTVEAAIVLGREGFGVDIYSPEENTHAA